MNHAFGPTASRSATDVYKLSGYYAEETLQSYNSDGVRITSQMQVLASKPEIKSHCDVLYLIALKQMGQWFTADSFSKCGL